MASLERIEPNDGVVVYRSALLASHGVRHAFSTRHGGVSPEPFGTMNLGIASAPGESDSEANVAANAGRLMDAIGAGTSRMVRVRQVHGSAVHACAPAAQHLPAPEADAVVSDLPSHAACVRTADCVPVLVACTATGAVAAIHAGWRGIVAGVVPRAVAALRERYGADPGAMAAAIGPCIGREVYEVGPEVASELARAVGGEHVLPAGPSRPREHIDCFGAVRAQLLACGVPARSIDGTELCTFRSPDFFSFRRDGARSGRMGAVIVPRPVSAPRSASP